MYKIFCFMVLILLGVACQKEGTLAPGDKIVNYFEAPAGATDEESKLRRAFQEETGSYLLFNDTLRKELLYRDEAGFPVYSFETVDLGYGIVLATRDKYIFRYLPSLDSKNASVNFVKERLLSLLDKKLYPYSFLLVDSVFQVKFLVENGDEVSKGFYSTKYPLDYYMGTRCLALSVGKVAGMNDQEKNEFAKGVFKGMVKGSLSLKVKELELFYAPGEKYYGKSGDTWEFGDFTDLRELGFLAGDIKYDRVSFPDQSTDLESFVDALFKQEKEFLEANKSFPLVIQKYTLLKKIVMDMGFRLDLLNK